jgi:hypothetical protein
MTTPMAARPKAWVCGRLLAGIAGSHRAGGMDVCLVSVVFCQVEVSATGRSPRSVESYRVCVCCVNNPLNLQ